MSCVNALQSPAQPARLSQASPSRRRPTTPGPTSPTCCTSSASAGATTSSPGTQPDCEDDAMTCTPLPQNAKTPGIWNPLPVLRHRRARTASSATSSRSTTSTPRREAGTLPAVSWVVPDRRRSASTRRRVVSAGQTYVTEPDQRDHAAAPTGTRPRSSSPGTTGAASTTTSRRPPSTQNGYGLRVPGHRDQPVRASRATSTTRR